MAGAIEGAQKVLRRQKHALPQSTTPLHAPKQEVNGFLRFTSPLLTFVHEDRLGMPHTAQPPIWYGIPSVCSCLAASESLSP